MSEDAPTEQERRLLVAEDDPDVAESIASVLSHPRLRIVRAATGAEAIVRAKQARPHAVVLDIWLPVIHGFQVFRHLRTDAALGDPRVILVSAVAAPETLAQAERLGAFASFRKPFDEESLRRTVLAAVGLREEAA